MCASARYIYVQFENKTYWIPNDPCPTVEVDRAQGKLTPKNEYHAGEYLTYKVERTALITTQGTTTRRIVRKFMLDGQLAREPVYIYPPQANAAIDEGHWTNLPRVQLPSDLETGEYTLETSLSFEVNGRLRTYRANTTPFKVVPK